MTSKQSGGFTLPGEAGYEDLSLALAERWGADAIRDSDGTKLNRELLEAGYEIYSTICIIRGHNAFAKAHPEYRQQCFLSSEDALSRGEELLSIDIMAAFSREQFVPDASPRAIKYWQVWDRTADQLLDPSAWSYDEDSGRVKILTPLTGHNYTVSFMAWRIWEEISMYNYVTNDLSGEHLIPLEPRHEAVQTYLKEWLEEWCREHPQTDVVRFTSLFYNFVWIWGSDPARRDIFTDWGDYNFSVSAVTLDAFASVYDYSLTAEDFVRQGKYRTTHRPPDSRKRDYMAFVRRFTADFAQELVEIVHRAGKKAYVFYDDSWIGLEPYGEDFKRIGFDGIIKCLFNAYEARLCAGVPVPTHELRLHPYLFPTGLGGAPSFSPGGDPAAEARKYWLNIRRALLRVKLERIGLGGYLHLSENYPDFVDAVTQIAAEFRRIRALHESSAVYRAPAKVLVLHAWGSLRPWTLCGHWHESDKHVLIHINEALAGLPLEVDFADFEEIKALCPDDYDFIINAGREGSAWSGGDAWRDPELIARLSSWTERGGCLIGVGEPSAVRGFRYFFRLAPLFGLDKDTGERTNHGRYSPREASGSPFIQKTAAAFKSRNDLYLLDPETEVLAAAGDLPLITRRRCGRGQAIYMSDFVYSPEAAQLLFTLMAEAYGDELLMYSTDRPEVDTAYFPETKTLLLANNSAAEQTVKVRMPGGEKSFCLAAFELREEVSD